VRIILSSHDVVHAFYVPDFLFKRDATPGLIQRFDLLVEREGTYRGQCAEFCGLDHARMTFTVRAVPPSEFEAWLEDARQAAVG
jgi:cytochrome c oxidase subunit II